MKLTLWSQIKLTSYYFSDLHITGEFDNPPVTGRFLGISSCVVTYRTSAGRRLYMITSVDARPGCVRCPAGVIRDQPDTVRCPGYFRRIFTCNNVYIYIKFRHHSFTETDSANLLRDFWKFTGLVKHPTMPGPSPLKSYDLNFNPKSSSACLMCANAGRCHVTLNGPAKRRPMSCYPQWSCQTPADVMLHSMVLPNAVRAPWNFK